MVTRARSASAGEGICTGREATPVLCQNWIRAKRYDIERFPWLSTCLRTARTARFGTPMAEAETCPRERADRARRGHGEHRQSRPSRSAWRSSWLLLPRGRLRWGCMMAGVEAIEFRHTTPSRPWRSSSPSMWTSTTPWFLMRPSPARRQMRCISVVATTFPESLLPAIRVPGQLAWSPTDACLAELVGRRSNTRPAFPIPLQIRACCICTTKCLECRDSQLGQDWAREKGNQLVEKPALVGTAVLSIPQTWFG